MSDDQGNDPRRDARGAARPATNVVSHLAAARKALDDALSLLRRSAARRATPGALKKPR